MHFIGALDHVEQGHAFRHVLKETTHPTTLGFTIGGLVVLVVIRCSLGIMLAGVAGHSGLAQLVLLSPLVWLLPVQTAKINGLAQQEKFRCIEGTAQEDNADLLADPAV
jgi:hypothetical protein